MPNRHFLFCTYCKDVKQVFPEPECVHFGKQAKGRSESVTVAYKNAAGKITIPNGDPNDPKVIAYAKANGLERVEYRGVRATRRLEKELDTIDRKRYEQHQLKLQNVLGPQHARRRADLHQIIREGQTQVPDGRGGQRTIRVTEMGRNIAREALRKMDQGGYSQRYEPGNYRRE